MKVATNKRCSWLNSSLVPSILPMTRKMNKAVVRKVVKDMADLRRVITVGQVVTDSNRVDIPLSSRAMASLHSNTATVSPRLSKAMVSLNLSKGTVVLRLSKAVTLHSSKGVTVLHPLHLDTSAAPAVHHIGSFDHRTDRIHRFEKSLV